MHMCTWIKSIRNDFYTLKAGVIALKVGKVPQMYRDIIIGKTFMSSSHINNVEFELDGK